MTKITRGNPKPPKKLKKLNSKVKIKITQSNVANKVIDDIKYMNTNNNETMPKTDKYRAKLNQMAYTPAFTLPDEIKLNETKALHEVIKQQILDETKEPAPQFIFFILRLFIGILVFIGFLMLLKAF